mgnify:FL=1
MFLYVFYINENDHHNPYWPTKAIELTGIKDLKAINYLKRYYKEMYDEVWFSYSKKRNTEHAKMARCC